MICRNHACKVVRWENVRIVWKQSGFACAYLAWRPQECVPLHSFVFHRICLGSAREENAKKFAQPSRVSLSVLVL